MSPALGKQFRNMTQNIHTGTCVYRNKDWGEDIRKFTVIGDFQIIQ